MISSNKASFETLFALFKSDKSIHPLLSTLLLRLPPAEHIHRHLITEPEWETFLADPSDTYSVVYQMQIVDSSLFPSTGNVPCSRVSYYDPSRLYSFLMS